MLSSEGSKAPQLWQDEGEEAALNHPVHLPPGKISLAASAVLHLESVARPVCEAKPAYQVLQSPCGEL